MKKRIQALVISGVCVLPAVAIAADSPHSFSGNVTLTSDYVFRGITQTGGDPAIQGGFDYSHKSGLYLGTWASNVGWIEDFQGYNSGNMEIDLYGGFRGGIGETGLTFDVGVLGYFYPGSKPAGVVTGDTTEIYGALGWKWFTVKYSYYLSDDVFGIVANGSDYVDVSASFPVGESGLTLGAHWGTFRFDDTPAADYDDWSVSATYDMGKVSDVLSSVTVGVKYTDTNANKAFWIDSNGKYLGDNAVFVWVNKAF